MDTRPKPLAAIVEIARSTGLKELYALCHPDHPRSIRVLEKCGFRLDSLLKDFAGFPNPGSGRSREDCL